jgi:hypothetical protein
MITPMQTNPLYQDYPTHFRPNPGLVLFCTVLIGALLSFFLYKITLKGVIFDYSKAQISGELSVLEELPSGDIGETPDWVDSSEPINMGVEEPEGVCSVSSRFPPAVLQWCGLITRYASRRGLPPDLVAALIWQESGGNPSAYSRSGAVGLMQVMPRDGLAASFTCVNGPCFGSRPTTQELQDPEYNIAFGTRLLAGLLSRHGDIREALKYYGPNNVGYYYADKVFGLFQRYGKYST